MAKQKASLFAVFQTAGGLPAGLFGETYVAVTARQTGPRVYEGEFFLLVQRPKPTLEHDTFKVDATNVPQDALPIDLDFIIQESKQQAEVRLIDLLYRRAKELKKPELVAVNVSLLPSPSRPFVGCWLRNAFRPQIRTIAKTTQEPSLQRYVAAVSSMP